MLGWHWKWGTMEEGGGGTSCQGVFEKGIEYQSESEILCASPLLEIVFHQEKLQGSLGLCLHVFYII